MSSLAMDHSNASATSVQETKELRTKIKTFLSKIRELFAQCIMGCQIIRGAKI